MPACTAAELAQITATSNGPYALVVAISVASLLFQRVLIERVPHEVSRLRYDPQSLGEVAAAIARQVRIIAVANFAAGVLLLTLLSPCHYASRACRADGRCLFWFPPTAAVMGMVYLWRAGKIVESARVGGGGRVGSADAAGPGSREEAVLLRGGSSGVLNDAGSMAAVHPGGSSGALGRGGGARASAAQKSGAKTELVAEVLSQISDEASDLSNYI